MKRLLLFVLLLAGVVFALPGGVGLVAEQSHERALAYIVSQGHPLNGSFTRGWFGSRAQHLYRIEDPQLRQVASAITGDYVNAPSLVVDSDLHHGPLPLATLQPAWTEGRSTLSLRDAAGNDVALPGQLSSRLEPDAQSQFRYQAEPGEQALHDNLLASWQHIDLELRLSRNADELSFGGEIERLGLSEGDAQMSIADVSVEGLQRRQAAGPWSGTTTWRVGSFSAPHTRADRVTLATDVSGVDDQPVYRITGTVGSLQSELVSGNDLRIDLELRNIDSASAAGLLALIADGRAIDIFSPQHRGLLSRLLAGGPQLTLHDLRVPAGDGDLEGTGRVRVAAGADPSRSGGLANAIDAQTNLIVPRSLVAAIAAAGTEQTRTAIELMIRVRILKPEGNRYRVKASYENGLLNVNGFPVPIPQL